MDERTRYEKLRAMAEQDVSPAEAEIARAKLATMGAVPPPPRRPTAVGQPPAPEPFDWSFSTTTTSSSNFTTNLNFRTTYWVRVND